MDSRFLSRSLFGISVLSALIFLFVFCLGPTKTLQTALSLNAERLSHFLPFFLLLSGMGSLFAFLLAVVFRIERNDVLSWGLQLSESRRQESPLLQWLPGLVALLVLGIALSQVGAPLHWEDLFHLSNIILSPWERFNPLIKTEHHTLASMAAYLSVKLFGMSKPAVLFPAFLFASGYLFILFRLGQRFLVGMSSLLLFAHLASNQMAVWYMHSMRGYCLAMLLCSATLYLLWSATESTAESMRRDRIALLLVSFAATFTHLFAALFVLIAMCSLALWVCLNRRSAEGWRIRHIQRLILDFLLFALPVYAFIIFFQVLWLERLGDFFKGGFPDITGTLLRTFGTSFVWSGRILLLLTILVVAASLLKFKANSKGPRFLSLLVLCLGVFLVTVMRVLEVRLLETRFLLPFLAPFVIWLGEGVSRIGNPVVRGTALGMAILGLVISPTMSRNGIYEYLTSNVRDYDHFVSTAQAKTAPVAENCYSFSGEPNLIYFSRTLYFGGLQSNAGQDSDCKRSYHLYFASPENLPPQDTRVNEPAAVYEPIYSVSNKMILFEKHFTKNELVGMQRWTP